MKGFSFESFDVTLPCRPAFEACRHIAEGEYAGNVQSMIDALLPLGLVEVVP